jgi:cell division protein FtsI (penicillin-binding protein 3)
MTTAPGRRHSHHHMRIEGTAKQAIESGRTRLLVAGALFTMAFAAIGFRLADVTLIKPTGEPRLATVKSLSGFAASRADIVDRNGVLLATSLNTASLYANPRQVLDAREAAAKLARALPGIAAAEILGKLESDRSFVWIKRHLTPEQQYAVNAAGIPGLYFQREERRVYPQGRLFAHMLGFAGTDGAGLAGIEKTFDDTLRSGGQALHLSVDARVQHILRQELQAAVTRFRADGAAAIVMDVASGEILSLVSLPDFDPNLPQSIPQKAAFNRTTLGVYEMGSTFKMFNTAMALDSGATRMSGSYDASKPIRIARFLITDYHAKKRRLSVPEIFMYSSNIGSVKMALDVGTERQKEYLRHFGMLSPAAIELPEVGTPLVPSPWREINTMTISFGHGIAVTPVQMVQATAAMINGGILPRATLLKPISDEPRTGTRVLQEKTSRDMRRLLRLVVTDGTGKMAAAPGYLIGGKTGTAEKTGGRGYRAKALVSSFAGAFPMQDPRYAILVVVDEPHGDARSFGYATGGWVAAPVVSRFVARAAPLLGIAPQDEGSRALARALDIPGLTGSSAAKATARTHTRSGRQGEQIASY